LSGAQGFARPTQRPGARPVLAAVKVLIETTSISRSPDAGEDDRRGSDLGKPTRGAFLASPKPEMLAGRSGEEWLLAVWLLWPRKQQPDIQYSEPEEDGLLSIVLFLEEIHDFGAPAVGDVGNT
jgi:hypothetical protein